jgi:two pore calcium channel protein, plant
MNTASAGSDPENDTNKKKEESTPLLRHSESSSVRFTKDTKPPSASERFRDFANLLFESFTEEARTRALEKRGVGPAAFLIRDAVLGEDEDPAEGAYDPYSQPEQGVRNVVSVVCRRLCSHRLVKFATKMAAWTLVFLSFVEPPNWCRNFPLVTTDDDKASLVHRTCRHVMALQGPAPDDATLTVDYYPNTSTILLTVREALLVEWACSMVLGLLLMLQIGRDGMSMTRYLRVGPARWVRGIELMAVTQLLVSLFIVDDYRGLAPFIRILVFFAFHRSSQREFGTLIKLMPEVLWVLSLLFVWLAFFAWIGVVAFYGSDQGTQHFPNLIEAMWTLWQMTTTVNYPDVMMPAYNENRVSVLYFVVYMVVTYFFLMNIILASVVNAYDNESEFRKKDHADKAESSLRQAFQLMDPEKEDIIDRDTVMALFLILNKDFPEFREIPNEEARILFAILDKDGSAVVSEEEFMCFGEILLLHFEKESSYATYIETHFPNLYKTLEYQRFCTIIKSDYFEYVIDVILVMNAIVVGIQSWPMLMGHTVDVDPHLEDGEIDTVWETFQTVFTIIYCLEAFVKVMVYGWKAYSEKHKNIFDLLITILSVAATAYVYYPNDFSDSAVIRLVVMARVFRLGRLLVALKPFRALIKISIDILPHTVNVMILLFIIMYFFAALGLELFGGWITRDPNNAKAHLLVGTDFADAAYWSNNFNDMSGGMNVLFNLLVINNWQVCSDGFEAVAGTLYTRFFFLSFHILGVIMVNNLVLAFIINSFIKEWDMFHEITHKEEVQGEAIIQDRKAVFDATQVTGSTTGLSGRYVARIEGGQLASERQQTILKYMFTSTSKSSSLMQSKDSSAYGATGS